MYVLSVSHVAGTAPGTQRPSTFPWTCSLAQLPKSLSCPQQSALQLGVNLRPVCPLHFPSSLPHPLPLLSPSFTTSFIYSCIQQMLTQYLTQDLPSGTRQAPLPGTEPCSVQSYRFHQHSLPCQSSTVPSMWYVCLDCLKLLAPFQGLMQSHLPYDTVPELPAGVPRPPAFYLDYTTLH